MKVSEFTGGLNTRLDPTLLPANTAAEMDNATPFSGVLKSERGPNPILDDNNNPLVVDDSFYNFKGDWVSGPNRDYVEYRDRLYWTDGRNPRVLAPGDVARNLDETDAEAVRLGLVKPAVPLTAVAAINSPMLIDRGRSQFFRYTLYDETLDIESPPSDEFKLEAIDTEGGGGVDLVQVVFTDTNNPKYTKAQGDARKATNPPTLDANAPDSTTNITHIILYMLVGTRYVEYQRTAISSGAVTYQFNLYSLNADANTRIAGPAISEGDVTLQPYRPPDNPAERLPAIAVTGREIGENSYVVRGYLAPKTADSTDFEGNTNSFSELLFDYTSTSPIIDVDFTFNFEWYNLPSGAKSSQTTVNVSVPRFIITSDDIYVRNYRVRIDTPNIRRHGVLANPYITHLAVSTNKTLTAGAVRGSTSLTARAITSVLPYTRFDFIPLSITAPTSEINVPYRYPINKFRGLEDRAEGEVTPPRVDGRILVSIRNEPAPAELINLTEAYTILFGSVGGELRFSVEDNPNAWPLENSITFPEVITGIFPIPAGVLVFSRNSTYLIKGTSIREFRRVLISSTEGCLHHRTCQLVKSSPVWLSNSGLCTYVNGYIRVLSQSYLDSVHIPSEGFNFSSAVFDERYFALVVRRNAEAVLVADFRNEGAVSFYNLTTAPRPSNFIGLRYHDGVLYGSERGEVVGPGGDLVVRNELVEFFKGEFLQLRYTSPSFTDGDHSMLKTYVGVYLRSKGRLIVTIKMDGRTAKTVVVDGDKTHDIKIPPNFQRGYALSVEIVGDNAGDQENVIYSIESRPEGRKNGR